MSDTDKQWIPHFRRIGEQQKREKNRNKERISYNNNTEISVTVYIYIYILKSAVPIYNMPTKFVRSSRNGMC